MDRMQGLERNTRKKREHVVILAQESATLGRRGNRDPHQTLDETTEQELEALFSKHAVFSSVHNPRTNKESTVVNETALQRSVDESVERSRARNRGDHKISKAQVLALLPGLVGHEPVLTARQVEAGDFAEKPFFYVPDTVGSAFNIAAIKKAKFHHFLTDFIRRTDRTFLQPTKRPEGDTASAYEAQVAAVVYHPDFGDGFRDEDGTLFVLDPETREYRRFSLELLKPYGVHDGQLTNPSAPESSLGGRRRSVREGMAVELPHIVAKGLLRPARDVRQITYGPSEVADQRVDRFGVSPAGVRTFRGVRHYIGNQFAGRPVRTRQISPQVGVVLEVEGGVERVTHLFNIISRDELAVRGFGPSKAGLYLANADITDTRPFSAESIALPRQPNESLERYHDRVEKTDRGLAHLLLNVFPRYPQLESSVRRNSLFELSSIAQAAYLLERDKKTEAFDAFLSRTGEAGARTFLVTSSDEQLRDQVFEFARAVPKENARKVFEAYGKLVDSIDHIGAYLQESFGKTSEEAVRTIVEKMLDRARGLLKDASQYQNDPSKLSALADAVRADNAMFFEAFRILRSSGDIKDFSGIKGLEFTNVDQSFESIPEVDRAEMIRIMERNYAEESQEFRRAVIDSLVGAFGAPASKFYILRLDGKVVGFNRFDEIGSEAEARPRRYFGSFNVDSNFGNGKLGEVLIEQTVLKEAETAILEADSTANAPITTKYIETGFVGTAHFDFKGVAGLHIVFDVRANERYVSKKLSAEAFLEKARANVNEDGVLYRTIDGVHGFEPLSQGYVLTRYLQPQRQGPFYAAFEKAPA